MATNPETKIQRAILDWLDIKKLWHKRDRNQNVRGDKYLAVEVPGFPDIFGVLPNGRMFAIEVKTPKGRLSQVQEQCISDLIANNVIVVVARSIEDLKPIEDELKKCIEQGLKPKPSESLAVKARLRHAAMLKACKDMH